MTTPTDKDLKEAPPGNPSANPPCPSCRGRCCRSYYVPVTGQDVWLINHHQRLAPEQFVQAVSTGETLDDNFFLQADGPGYCLALDKKGKFDRYSSCVFLMDLPGGYSRCGIYGHRPGTCRIYPMKMSWGIMSLSEHAVCQRDEWPAEEIARPEWRTVARRLYMDHDVWVAVVGRWNARVALHPEVEFSAGEFLSYVMNVYERLNGLEKATGDEEIARLARVWPGPPRSIVTLDEMRFCRGDMPWLDYLAHAHDVIDRFYPEVPPQPVLVPMPVD